MREQRYIQFFGEFSKFYLQLFQVLNICVISNLFG